jgi:hypothetical protein
MKWIKSGGGPLICVESKLASAWFGVLPANDPAASHSSGATDYDRACSVRSYLGTVELPGGSALILGDMPLETSTYRAASGSVLIARLFYIEPDADIPPMLEDVDRSSFADPEETLIFHVDSEPMAIFDSAFSGSDKMKKTLDLFISPGVYRILTKIFNPDDRTSILVHKFYSQN